ncbi:MAG: hypothetical protein K0S23_3448 [Fluviicola sp.]|uniref:T9SS type A sorting domain-containing protein n=1 Tax=Fluviicola sp. TaxID=1917219 RepID=UPI00260ACE7B|nr:T9SS type A sorting domain-containing protein [Fluviicola sp.]MDF3029141.1 hypothetical protein [Fluviicola sp.]
MLKSTILSLAYCLLFIPNAFFAQCVDGESELVAPYASTDSNDGIMFDITTTNEITIFCFDANLPSSTTGSYEIYYTIGTYVGSENTAANWTLVGSSGSVTSNGANTATPLDIPVNLVIPAGQTYGFYITASNPAQSTALLSTSNAGYGTISSNADLTISGGIGITYPFSTISPDKSFNGTVHYMPGSALPVEFIDFTAVKINESVLLEWGTEFEINNDYFEIERSSNAIDWNRLLTTKAAGESTSPKEYQEVDTEPLDGISYYRLSQYDFDGKQTVLKTVSLNNKLEIGPFEIRVFPNPVTERVRVFGSKNELESLRVFNSIGQDISRNLSILPHNGYSEVYFDNQQEGVFVLKTKTNSQIIIKK